MNLTKFSSNDEEFTMVVDVLDKNTVIGILETLRDFDSIDYLIVDKIEEVEVKLEDEEVERLGLDKIEKPAANDGEEDEDEEIEIVIEDDDEGEGDEEETEGLTVSQTGTIYMKHDFENDKDYYIRKYVEFTVTCVYAQGEEIVIESNVTEEGAE